VRLGIAVQHYDARNDIRDLISLLGEQCEIILFAIHGALGRYIPPQEVRYIKSSHRHSLWFWQQLFRFFGALPRSAQNYFISEVFKLANVQGFARLHQLIALRCRMIGPRFFKVSQLLARLADCDCTPIDDIDTFLFITEFSSIAFLAHVLEAGKPASAYVYSWDHPCKHTVMPQEVSSYFVWNSELAKDMCELQGVPEKNCTIIGATQLAYIKSYLESPGLRKRRIDPPYFYFGCGVGNIRFAVQEARVIEYVAHVLAEKFPKHRLIVRHYPMFTQNEFFERLRGMPNVVFDNAFTMGRIDRSLTLQDIYQRLNLQEHADAFLHIGTTMGLEGTYLGTPVLLLDLEDFDYGESEANYFHLRKFIHQYHIERYMILHGYPNVIRNTNQISQVLQGVVEHPREFLAYNHAISSITPLRSLEKIAENIIGHMKMALRT
jgi:hypothetical protein